MSATPDGEARRNRVLLGPSRTTYASTKKLATDVQDLKQAVNGRNGTTGATGPRGAAGKSAYELAVDNGYTGTLADWLAGQGGGGSSVSGAAGFGNWVCTDGITGTLTVAVPGAEPGSAEFLTLTGRNGMGRVLDNGLYYDAFFVFAYGTTNVAFVIGYDRFYPEGTEWPV